MAAMRRGKAGARGTGARATLDGAEIDGAFAPWRGRDTPAWLQVETRRDDFVKNCLGHPTHGGAARLLCRGAYVRSDGGGALAMCTAGAPAAAATCAPDGGGLLRLEPLGATRRRRPTRRAAESWRKPWSLARARAPVASLLARAPRRGRGRWCETGTDVVFLSLISTAGGRAWRGAEDAPASSTRRQDVR